MFVVNMPTPEAVGRTILESFCVECRDSPRAPRAAVVLSGPSGFPPRLFGSCPNCGVEFVAVQVGVVTARPLGFVYNAQSELRSYRVFVWEAGAPRGASFDGGPGVWEL